VKTLALSSPRVGIGPPLRSAQCQAFEMSLQPRAAEPRVPPRRSNLDACSLAPNVGSASSDVINFLHGWLIVGGR
jgi:hypothetical protein